MSCYADMRKVMICGPGCDPVKRYIDADFDAITEIVNRHPEAFPLRPGTYIMCNRDADDLEKNKTLIGASGKVIKEIYGTFLIFKISEADKLINLNDEDIKKVLNMFKGEYIYL